MKNKIIKTVMIIDIILFIYSICAIEKYCNIQSILLSFITIFIFAWFISVNQNYFQKKVDKMLGR